MPDHDHTEAPISQRILDAASDGCEESRLYINRRAFMGLSATFCSWAYMPRVARAGVADPRLLVVVLRGGMDGLQLAVPRNDPYYAGLRGGIAVDKTKLLPLDNDFGLHPTLPNLGAMFNAGDAAIVTAVAPPVRVRSHFECTDNLENGFPVQNYGSASGWLNRLLTHLPAGSPVKSRGALEVGTSPLILFGSAPVLSWSSEGFTGMPAPFDDRLIKYYKKADVELYDLLSTGIAMKALAQVGETPAAEGEVPTVLRRAFRGAARLLAQPTGPRIAVLSVDGWDTHNSQQVTMSKGFANLDTGLMDFRLAIEPAWNDTVVVCVTEFGRTAAVNGSAGTDHGVGTVALLLGGAVAGKRVHGDWPGLGPDQLFEKRDIRATTDLRAVFKGILADHLGVGRATLDTLVFPESAAVAPMTGLIRSITSPQM